MTDQAWYGKEWAVGSELAIIGCHGHDVHITAAATEDGWPQALLLTKKHENNVDAV